MSSGLFEELGGWTKCRELSTAFYARVAKDPILSPLFPGKTFTCAIEEFAAFLAQLLGGPSENTQRRWWVSLRESHLRFQIRKEQRDAWMGHMKLALIDVEMSGAMRSALSALFEEASAYVVNTGPAVTVTKGSSALSPIHVQIDRRWEEQRAIDEAVAAVRDGELHRAIALLESPQLQSCFQRNRSMFAMFVGLLIGHGDEYAQCILRENPDLAFERYAGRALLHTAAAAGNLPMVEALLNLGVDANIQDSGGHTPLYSVANECPHGGPVVKALIQAGAKVDACDGVKRCTALHMAARRDHVEVAEALLACGADIEARDSQGETPLRRAVNCGQTRVAALLLAKGANPHSIGSKGLTPVTAGRTAAMRELLQSVR